MACSGRLFLAASFLTVAGLGQTSCVTIPPIQNTTDLSHVDFSKIKDFKRGESCTTFLLGFIPFGSTRIVAAVQDARIQSLKIVEYEYRYYYIVNQFCLIAYGT